MQNIDGMIDLTTFLLYAPTNIVD